LGEFKEVCSLKLITVAIFDSHPAWGVEHLVRISYPNYAENVNRVNPCF
jgi:hypothetical protein